MARSDFDFRRLGWFATGFNLHQLDKGLRINRYRISTMKPPFKGPNKIKKKVFFAL